MDMVEGGEKTFEGIRTVRGYGGERKMKGERGREKQKEMEVIANKGITRM